MVRLGEHIHPLLTGAVLENLHQKSIFTTLNFIDAHSEFLVRVTGLQYKKVLKIRDVIFSQFASHLTVGYNYYQDILSHGAIISTGVQSLDNLLDGGFVTGHLYELCGPSGCGKTQISMTAAVNTAIKLPQNVLFLDTKNDVTAHRLLQILENGPDHSDVGTIMKKIVIQPIKNAYELLTVLHNLTNMSVTYRLVIIDSLTAVFYQFLGDHQAEGFNLLNSAANMMHFIAVECHAAVVVTNLLTTWAQDCVMDRSEGTSTQQQQRAALGKYWAHVPSVRIHVRQLNRSCESLVTISKSTSHPIGKSAKITISNKGVT